MAFVLPAGLTAYLLGEGASDSEIAQLEGGLSSGTRVLVAIGFAARWPGFGTSADIANGLVAASTALTGLQKWPELGRFVTPDDTEPVWYFTYMSSPAWWLLIIIAVAAVLAAVITFRFAWMILPEEARGGLELVGNIVPLLALGLILGVVMPMTKGILGKEG